MLLRFSIISKHPGNMCILRAVRIVYLFFSKAVLIFAKDFFYYDLWLNSIEKKGVIGFFCIISPSVIRR